MRAAFCTAMALLAAAAAAQAEANDPAQAVIDEVEKACVERRIYMIGRKKAERLASGRSYSGQRLSGFAS